MALQKAFTTPTGLSGNYIRLTKIGWDRNVSESYAEFGGFTSKAAADARAQPIWPVLAKLRLNGAKFSAYVSNGKLAVPADILAAFYAAAKAENLICDLGQTWLADATNV